MWQAIAEVVKQGMKNIASSGKNAQSNASVANGGVGLVNTDIKKTDAQSNNTEVETTPQNTQDTSSVETTTQETNEESEEGDSNNGVMATSDKNTKISKDVSSENKKESDMGTVTDNIKKMGEGLNKAGTTAKVQGSVSSFTPISSTVVSDERLKDIFGEETPIDCFAKIHAYEFKYTPQAQEIMQGKDHVDDKEHLGVMAQELLANPATSACVIKDTDGFLKVDTAQLTMANTATIAELSRKIQKLEEMLGER